MRGVKLTRGIPTYYRFNLLLNVPLQQGVMSMYYRWHVRWLNISSMIHLTIRQCEVSLSVEIQSFKYYVILYRVLHGCRQFVFCNRRLSSRNERNLLPLVVVAYYNSFTFNILGLCHLDISSSVWFFYVKCLRFVGIGLVNPVYDVHGGSF